MARSLGYLALAGPLLVLVWLALPRDEHVPPARAAVVVVCSLALAATALSGRFDRSPPWVFQLLLAVAPLLVTPFVVWTDSPDSGFALLYVWATPYAYCWFSLRVAAAQTAWVGVCALTGLQLSRHVTDPFTDQFADILLLVGTIVAVGLFSRGLMHSLRRAQSLRLHRERVLVELGQASLDSTEPGTVSEHALEIALRELGADFAALAEQQPDGTLRMVAVAGPPGADLWPVGSPVPGDRATLLACAIEDGVMVSDDLWHDSRVHPVTGVTGEELTGGVAVRVRDHAGGLGAISVYSRSRRFTTDDATFLSALGNLVSAARSRLGAEEQLRHQALHDPLTGLPNRALLAERLDRALIRARRRAEESVAVILIDIDRFKQVNDSLGHPVGDQLLHALADRLGHLVRAEDTLARMGGDEFVIVTEGIAGETHALEVARRVAEAWAAPFTVAGTVLHVEASTGVAISVPGIDPDALLANADAAMYRAKRERSGAVALYDDDLRERATHQLLTEQGLRQALRNDELRVQFQPIVDPRTLACSSLEALVRWEHPQRGLVLPGAFIAVAEESGLIVPLGARVLELSLEQLACWRGEPGLGELSVSVNVSAHQLREPAFATAVADALDRYGLPPEALTLELTERVVLDPHGPAARCAAALRATGVGLALDDFGTGWSSLSALRSLPLSTLKIDRSFVTGLGSGASDGNADACVISGILLMARGNGLTVVAEGVETAQQAAALAALGCDRAQGYHYAPPLQPEDAATFLRGGGGLSPRARLRARA
jgi:diguanylate cyclase (GGDEF)-like protein